jgi:hypothetical protein
MIDRNGYLPVHNKIYSHPQRPGDVAWNTANSRNRRIFNDPAGLAAGRNLRAYLIQSYARDMGNGKMVMMREIDVPIRVNGRHWGGFRTAYRLECFVMQLAALTFKSIRARPVVLKLKRPVVARIATITEWPLILIDLFTEEGIVGRSYLEPYTIKTMRYLIPALQDFGEMLKGRPGRAGRALRPRAQVAALRRLSGQSMIAVSGLDMAAWDALAKASGVPLCVLLGGSVGPVKAYNSNGLWLQPPEFWQPRPSRCATKAASPAEAAARPRSARDDLAAIEAVGSRRRTTWN